MERALQIKRIMPTLTYEKALQMEGFFCIAGIDEAGRGAWAGPASAAAVILPNALDASFSASIRDSKLLTPAQRKTAAVEIRERCVGASIAFATAAEIDEIGILNATKLAMTRAISGLIPAPDALLIDFIRLDSLRMRQRTPAHGDRDSLTIAAASILAKTARDEWMERAAEAAYPGYGFARHKGYGTRIHQEALITLGVSPIHRHSYAPVRSAAKRIDALRLTS